MRKMFLPVVLLCFLLLLSACGNKNTKIESSSESTTGETSHTTTADTSDTSTENSEAETSESDSSTTTQSSSSMIDNTPAGNTSGANSKPSGTNPQEQTPSQSTSSSASSTTSSATSTTPPANVRTCVYNAVLSDQVFTLVNNFRAENSVAKLTYNATNAGYAKAQAEYNAVNDVADKAQHTSRQIGACGTGINTRGGASAIPSIALTNWQNSAGHRTNMLNEKFTLGGVAVYEIRYNGVCEEYVVILDFDRSDAIKSDPGIRK